MDYRHLIRLPGYDYAQPNAYFVTICAFERECLFGEIMDGEMRMNEVGMIVQERLLKSFEICQEIESDGYIIMPNHIHCIIWIVGACATRLPMGLPDRSVEPTGLSERSVEGAWHAPLRRPRSLSSFVGLLKSATTSRFRQLRRNDYENLWQRNYYEHIIRSEREMYAIRQYIQNNPQQWEQDSEFNL